MSGNGVSTPTGFCAQNIQNKRFKLVSTFVMSGMLPGGSASCQSSEVRRPKRVVRVAMGRRPARVSGVAWSGRRVTRRPVRRRKTR